MKKIYSLGKIFQLIPLKNLMKVTKMRYSKQIENRQFNSQIKLSIHISVNFNQTIRRIFSTNQEKIKLKRNNISKLFISSLLVSLFIQFLPSNNFNAIIHYF